MAKNYYDILGIDEKERLLQGDEFKKILTKKYRLKAMEFHPDRHVNDSEEEKKKADENFKEINEANSVLSDPVKRNNYDQFGTAEGMGNFEGFDPFGGGFNPFGEDFNPFGRFGGRQRVNKGEDIVAEVTLTEKEAFLGAKKEVTIKKAKPCSHCHGTGSVDGKDTTCPHCHGTGRICTSQQRGNMTMIQETSCPHCQGTGKIIKNPCSHCHGTGIEYETEKMPFDIPAGVFEGATIVGERLGSAPNGNGINGDLYVNIHVIESGNFRRIKDNVVVELNLTLEEAWCGCEKNINNIDGTIINIKIPELTPCGQEFIKYGLGYTNPQIGRKGNFIAVVNYKTPNKINKEQKELLKKFYEFGNK